jgi:outer membrane protein assembly factor BamB
MDSAWPMYCHDTRHTGRSPYSTADNPGWEKWRVRLSQVSYHCAPVIDKDGVIYVGRGDLFAVYPNGTLKWEYEIIGIVESAPAIDENGILYVGSYWGSPNYLYAIYSSNGTLKWKYRVGHHVDGSPAIGSDGAIYLSNWNGDIYALNPNGTLKWMYHTGDVVTSSPAIGLDGTVYCGSHDDHVYAFYPNNGTVKWSFNTGSWVHGSPTIAADGTVYIGSDNGNLYAFYPNNGTVKWQISVGAIGGSPSLDENGNIYVGVFQQKFYAIYPNGTVKWTYDTPGRIWFGASAAISADGFIYFGTTCMDGGEGAFIVLNPDGSERMDYRVIGYEFETSPAIGADGTVYVCSSYHSAQDFGLLHAFGPQQTNDPPTAPSITGPLTGKAGTSYDYKFVATDPDRNPVSYYVKWGDDTHTGWTDDYNTGEEITLSHTWSSDGTFTIKAKAKDTFGAEGPEASLTVTMPRNRATYNSLFLRFLEQFPILQMLLQR